MFAERAVLISCESGLTKVASQVWPTTNRCVCAFCLDFVEENNNCSSFATTPTTQQTHCRRSGSLAAFSISAARTQGRKPAARAPWATPVAMEYPTCVITGSMATEGWTVLYANQATTRPTAEWLRYSASVVPQGRCPIPAETGVRRAKKGQTESSLQCDDEDTSDDYEIRGVAPTAPAARHKYERKVAQHEMLHARGPSPLQSLHAIMDPSDPTAASGDPTTDAKSPSLGKKRRSVSRQQQLKRLLGQQYDTFN